MANPLTNSQFTSNAANAPASVGPRGLDSTPRLLGFAWSFGSFDADATGAPLLRGRLGSPRSGRPLPVHDRCRRGQGHAKMHPGIPKKRLTIMGFGLHLGWIL